MVEVFKTNVREVDQSLTLVQELLGHFPGSRINFDLEDCDNILRVEGNTISTEFVINLLQSTGFECSLLE